MNSESVKVIEVIAVLDLGVAVGSLTVIGYTEAQILEIVHMNIQKAREGVALVESTDG